jgi:hypothetical protein
MLRLLRIVAKSEKFGPVPHMDGLRVNHVDYFRLARAPGNAYLLPFRLFQGVFELE